jgi:hypothetical protein
MRMDFTPLMTLLVVHVVLGVTWVVVFVKIIQRLASLCE